jgi:hypothetical protein
VIPADRLLVGLGLLGACALGILIGMPSPHEIQTSNPVPVIEAQEFEMQHSEYPEALPLIPSPTIRDEYTVTESVLIPSPVQRPFYEFLEPCAQEDSGQFYDCYWDASVRGNGQGRSFYAIDGVFYGTEWEDASE